MGKENLMKKKVNMTCSLEHQQLPQRVGSSSFPFVFCIWVWDCTPTCKVESSIACLHSALECATLVYVWGCCLPCRRPEQDAEVSCKAECSAYYLRLYNFSEVLMSD